MQIDIISIEFVIKDIKELNRLIDLHKNLDDDDFMVAQYEARKAYLLKDLIEASLHSGLNHEYGIDLISLVIKKLYKKESCPKSPIPHELKKVYQGLSSI